MSEVPMEYKVFKKKFFKSVKKALGDDLVGIIVYGGSASERIFSGVSDVDFFILLKSLTELSQSLSSIYEKLSGVILEYVSNPLFAAILDYDVYTMDQIPKGKKLNGFSAIRALALSTGELLVGENPFDGMKFTKSQLRDAALAMVQEYLIKLTQSSIVMEYDDEETRYTIEMEQQFNAVDAVLSSAQAYHMINKGEYISMPDIVLSAETDPIDGWDNKIIQEVGLLRQGVETTVDDLYNRAIDFVGDVLKLII